MKRLLLALVLFTTFLSFAAESWRNGVREPLWPEGKIPHYQPHQIAEMTDAAKSPDFNPDAHRMPYLEWFEKPEHPNGVCVILISGGAYKDCCDVGLVKAWKEKFTAIGCQTVNLVYRTPRPHGLAIHQSAWDDGQRAVRLVRAEAAARGYDPEKIATVSMSAGSHLNVLLSTSSLTPAYEPVDELDTTVPCHINWAFTGAIAYGLSDGFGKPNARMGDGVDITLDPAFKFDAKTAPMCMFHGGRDIYSPLASTQVYRQLRRMKVPAELHLYADMPHNFWPREGWFERMHEFMVQMGFLGPLPKEVELESRYPNDVPFAYYAKADVWPEGKMPDVQTNQCNPYIEWFVPSNLTTKAIQIIYSGGSYMGNGTKGFEVRPMRRFLNEKGMAVVTLKYRTPRPLNGLQKHVTAWQDLQRTIRLVRSQAAERGLDPNRIGIMGSSAGGHLTLMGATSSRHQAYWPIDGVDKLPCNVQWAIAIYPAYALTDGGEKTNVHGGNDDGDRLVPEFSFDPDTCPTVFIHGDADSWAAMNSVKAWEQMRRMGIQGDLHTLCKRGHCFQRAASPGTGSYTWMNRAWEFIKHKGINR